MGGKDSISKTEWPEPDEKALHQAVFELVVQVNGKLRGRFSVQTGISEEQLKAKILADNKIKQFIDGKPIKKFIVVQNKLVNIVV